MLDFAVASGSLEHNPAQRLKEIQGSKLLPRKAHKELPPGLTDVEIEALSRAYPSHEFMVQFLAYTGLRFGEAIALRLSDIDLLAGTVTVSKAYSKVGGRLELSQTKSGKYRLVPIPKFLHTKLLEILVSRTDRHGLLFPNSEGKPLDDSRFRKGLKKAAKKALGREVSTHSLRHTYASLSVRAGTNPKVLAEAMGHSDIRLTMDLYASILDGDRQAHAELLNVARTRSLSDKSSQIVPTFDKQKGKSQSRLGDLNPGPTHYECVALPLS